MSLCLYRSITLQHTTARAPHRRPCVHLPGCARFAQMYTRTVFPDISIFRRDSFDSHQRMGHAGRETSKTLRKIAVMGPQFRKHTKASTSRTTGRNTCWPHALLSHRRAIRCHLANSSTSPTGGHKRELCTCPEPQGAKSARKPAASEASRAPVRPARIISSFTRAHAACWAMLEGACAKLF